MTNLWIVTKGSGEAYVINLVRGPLFVGFGFFHGIGLLKANPNSLTWFQSKTEMR